MYLCVDSSLRFEGTSFSGYLMEKSDRFGVGKNEHEETSNGHNF